MNWEEKNDDGERSFQTRVIRIQKAMVKKDLKEFYTQGKP